MTDEQIKQYFLGRISQTEAEDLEEKTALDAALTERVQMIEAELVEDYLQDEFSQTDRDSFEKNYLTTESRRQNLAFTQTFLKNVKQPPPKIVQTAPQISYWQTVFGDLRARIVFVCAVLLIFTFAVIYIFFLSNNRKESEIAERQNSNQAATPESVNRSNGNLENLNVNLKQTNNVNTNKPEKTPTPTATPKNFEPTFAAFTLLPGNLRSGGEQFVRLSPKTTKVSFLLTLPGKVPEYESYSISVETSDGAKILTTANQKSHNLTIPAAKLENGTYIIFLKGNSAAQTAESVAEYTFRVSR